MQLLSAPACVYVLWMGRCVSTANCRLRTKGPFQWQNLSFVGSKGGNLRQSTFPPFLAVSLCELSNTVWKVNAKILLDLFCCCFKAVNLKGFCSWSFSSLTLFWMIEREPSVHLSHFLVFKSLMDMRTKDMISVLEKSLRTFWVFKKQVQNLKTQFHILSSHTRTYTRCVYF